jgi:hypothetical protein
MGIVFQTMEALFPELSKDDLLSLLEEKKVGQCTIVIIDKIFRKLEIVQLITTALKSIPKLVKL